MPILRIRALPQKDSTKVQNALQKTCLAIAKAYGCEPQQVWATWEEIQPGLYTEGDVVVSKQPQETHPPICELLCFEGANPDKIEKTLKATSESLSLHLGLKNNLFIHYKEAKSGQVIAGNNIVRKS